MFISSSGGRLDRSEFVTEILRNVLILTQVNQAGLGGGRARGGRRGGGGGGDALGGEVGRVHPRWGDQASQVGHYRVEAGEEVVF